MGLGCSKDDATGKISCSEDKLNKLFAEFETRHAALEKAQNKLMEGLERVAPVDDDEVEKLVGEMRDYVRLEAGDDQAAISDLQRRLEALKKGGNRKTRRRHNKRKRVIKSRKKRVKKTRNKKKKRGNRKRRTRR